MLILSVTYTQPIEAVERHAATHMDWVKQGYERGYFLASGRKVPRVGGVILARGDRAIIEEFLQQDPFVLHDVGRYEITDVAFTRAEAGLDALVER